MGRVLTNRTSLAFTVETSPGVAGTNWFLMEPNGLGTFGAEITTVPRSPISKRRQRRKGTTVDLDSAVDWEGDLILDQFEPIVEGFAFAKFVGPTRIDSVTGGLVADNDVPGAGVNGFTHSAIAAALANNTIIKTRGFANAVNNGTFLVDGPNSTTTVTAIQTTPGIVDETPAATRNARLEVCGVRSATGDLDLDSNGNLTSTTLNFTTLGLTVGQVIHVGGLLTANRFTNALNTGFARITAIAANLLTLDKNTFVTEANTTQAVDLLFGRFLRNVDVDHADFIERYFQWEVAFKNLQVPGPGDEYQYAIGNLANELSFQLPLTDKALVGYGFIGQDTENPTTTRKTGASAPINPVNTTAFNTSADIARLRIQKVDETGITTDFKSLTLVMRNNVSGEKVLGYLGSKFLNTGNFEVDVEAQLLFTDSRVVTAIRSNETLTMDFVIKNSDGGIAVDIPSLTLGGGQRELPVNESVLINTTALAFEDAVLGTSIGISLFPLLP